MLRSLPLLIGGGTLRASRPVARASLARARCAITGGSGQERSSHRLYQFMTSRCHYATSLQDVDVSTFHPGWFTHGVYVLYIIMWV